MAGPKKRGDRNDDRPNGKAWKKTPKLFSPEKRRLIKGKNK